VVRPAEQHGPRAAGYFTAARRSKSKRAVRERAPRLGDERNKSPVRASDERVRAPGQAAVGGRHGAGQLQAGRLFQQEGQPPWPSEYFDSHLITPRSVGGGGDAAGVGGRGWWRRHGAGGQLPGEDCDSGLADRSPHFRDCGAGCVWGKGADRVSVRTGESTSGGGGSRRDRHGAACRSNPGLAGRSPCSARSRFSRGAAVLHLLAPGARRMPDLSGGGGDPVRRALNRFGDE